MATFVIAAPEYLGFRHNRFFRIAGPNREPDDWGPRFFNRMMTAMGYGEGNRGEKARQEICRQRPAVLLKLTAGNPGFVNTQVVRRFDSDTDDLEACRAWIADHMDAAQGAKP